jgi:hypothetical protein
MIARCNVSFTTKTVLINNVNDIAQVRHYAEKKVKQGVIDRYYIVEEHAKAALDFFNIDIHSFNGGYYYSIAELVGIFLCKTPYLLHFSSDSFPDGSHANWINDAIAIFRERKDVVVANPTWDFKYWHAEEESFDSIRNFYLGYGFSDQCYLIKVEDFRQPVYNEKHAFSERYPEYGGELFEKRVDSYMRNHQLLRITSKESSYIHQNFPKDKKERFRLKLKIYFNRPLHNIDNTK